MPKQKDSTDDTTTDQAPQVTGPEATTTQQPPAAPPPETPATPQSTPAASTPATSEAAADDPKAAAEKKLTGELGEGPVHVVYDDPDGPPLVGIGIGGGQTVYFEKGVSQPLTPALAAKMLLSDKGFSRAAAPAPQQT